MAYFRPHGLQNPVYVNDLYVTNSSLESSLKTATSINTNIANQTAAGPTIAKLTVAVADLTAAAGSQVFEFAANIPADAVVLGAWFQLNEVFAGGTISACTVDLGVKSGDADGIIDAEDIFTAADTGHRTAFANTPALTAGSGLYVNAAAWTPQVTITATGDNVVDATTGSVDVYILYSAKPLGAAI